MVTEEIGEVGEFHTFVYRAGGNGRTRYDTFHGKLLIKGEAQIVIFAPRFSDEAFQKLYLRPERLVEVW